MDLKKFYQRNPKVNLQIFIERNKMLMNLLIKAQLKMGHPVNSIDNKVALFISVPKNASKEILHMFQLGFNRDIDSEDPREHFIVHENHQRACVLEERYDLNKLYTFAFVRNPYSRTISWFNYHRSLGIAEYDYDDINHWVSSGMPTHYGIQNLTDWSTEGITPLLQSNFIRCKYPLDFIGKIENFQEDITALATNLNKILKSKSIPKNLRVSKIGKNATKGKKSILLSQASRDYIYSTLIQDFIDFNYER